MNPVRQPVARALTRSAAEDFLFHEAALLDEWRLDEWLDLLTEDATYRVPPNDARDGDPARTLFLVADDAARVRARVRRLKDSNAHAEAPRSRTRRLIANVRVVSQDGAEAEVHSNFVVYRFRANEQIREYVGAYRHTLVVTAARLRIRRREARLDGFELASLGAISIIL